LSIFIQKGTKVKDLNETILTNKQVKKAQFSFDVKSLTTAMQKSFIFAAR